MRVWTNCEVCGVGTKSEENELEALCPPCFASELGEARELAFEALRQPTTVAGYVPKTQFGTGENEIPSSAIVSALAARELEERRGGRLIVGEVVLVGLTLAAVAVAELPRLIQPQKKIPQKIMPMQITKHRLQRPNLPAMVR